MKKYPFTSILGWSSSRNDVFTSCKRKYFYTYYAKYDQEQSLEKINSLKKLTSVALEIGNITHDIIRDILFRLQKSDASIHIQKLEAYIEKLTHDYCNSKQFFEVYYGQLNSVPIDKIQDTTSKSINNFIESQRYEWIRTRSNESKANWIIEPIGFGETRINDLKAYCKVDFLLPDGDKSYILDWKTGKKDPIKHKKQLLGYSLFAQNNLGFQTAQISPIVVYLKDIYEEMTFDQEENEIENFYAIVDSETKEMYDFLVNVDQNIPKQKVEFPMIEKTGLCAFCEYKELCKR
jgi:hypothetical protein